MVFTFSHSLSSVAAVAQEVGDLAPTSSLPPQDSGRIRKGGKVHCSLRRPPPSSALSRKVNHAVLNRAGHFQSNNIGAALATLLNSFF